MRQLLQLSSFLPGRYAPALVQEHKKGMPFLSFSTRVHRSLEDFPFFSISQMTSDVIVAKVGARIISPIVKLLLLIDVVPAVVAQVSPSRMWDRVALVLLPHEAP